MKSEETINEQIRQSCPSRLPSHSGEQAVISDERLAEIIRTHAGRGTRSWTEAQELELLRELVEWRKLREKVESLRHDAVAEWRIAAKDDLPLLKERANTFATVLKLLPAATLTKGDEK